MVNIYIYAARIDDMCVKCFRAFCRTKNIPPPRRRRLLLLGSYFGASSRELYIYMRECARVLGRMSRSPHSFALLINECSRVMPGSIRELPRDRGISAVAP